MEAIIDATALIIPCCDDPAPSHTPPRLPPELLLLTLEHLRTDRETLQQTCLVSKLWLHICQPYLFEHVCVSAPRADRSEDVPTGCALLYGVLSGSPHLAQYIRHLTILGGALWTSPLPVTTRWIVSEETLPSLLLMLSTARVHSLRIRLANHEHWRDLPDAFKNSLRELINSPSMRDLDFTGFDWVSASLLCNSRALKRLKLSETASGIINQDCEADGPDLWPATCESLTVLDTVHAADIISWVICTPSFRTLRELRLGFHPLEDVPHVEDLLHYTGDSLESLHLQPVYSPWPDPANFISISALAVLTSLRLSLGLSGESNPLPWATFILRSLSESSTSARLHTLTLDLRVGENRADAEVRMGLRTLPWAALDEALNTPHLANLRALRITCFEYKPPFVMAAAAPALAPVDVPEDVGALLDPERERGILEWFREELPRLLPRSRARDVFQAYELDFEPSRFFYWPGPISWNDVVRV